MEGSIYWQERYEQLSRRMHPNKAVVAIAHHLLIAVWHVLTDRATDAHADPKRVAVKLMRWSWDLTDDQRGGLTSRRLFRNFRAGRSTKRKFGPNTAAKRKNLELAGSRKAKPAEEPV